ncbi:hypothetical protein PHYSODRAFT_324542 [Phytophthora sojae]|uniref:Ricin B lectin domain-containing protein n=1 Tax=Phytophthora sojae (strain P6497) TaxID=1094619 RepID=G4YZ36_PHYSP|nr:hypothetical protein PHYSODRAFT_324542 [Phytophthora sojae]EGZ23317.1 hypothetical protein PHYSODRAFT_324542 [Phytophthora sojae]|eukprot:XP_009518605.1 hypothetical protein PHYSODRAFT_324542 [Phytophthora sojae]
MDNERNQKWTYDNATSTLQHATHKGFCPDQDASQNNKIQLYGCSPNNAHQQWEVLVSDVVPDPTAERSSRKKAKGKLLRAFAPFSYRDLVL